MNKTVKWVLIVLVLIIAAGGVFAYTAIAGDDIDEAILNVEEGSVEVDQGSGYKTATDRMDLSLNDKIKTGEGTASVTFFEGVIVELDKNTEITIRQLSEKNIGIKQEKGATWSKFTAVTGVQSQTIETPTSVATVRGTEFGVTVNEEDGEEWVEVGENQVEIKTAGQVVLMNEFEKAIKQKEEQWGKKELTKEDKMKMIAKAKKSLNRMKKMRERMLEKKRVQRMMNIIGVNKEKAMETFDKIDRGELNEDNLIEKSPIKPKVMQRMVRLNKEVRKQQELIKKMEASLA
ncbi:MAG: FecR domain-containing protein [Candidatus Woesearchaeota archaeon]|nr:MAG: FecR domain-containing protein [Candidatus Woesearchaeota archaeon]